MNSYISTVRQELARVKLEVQNALGWTDQQYANFQMDQGIDYLYVTFGEDCPLLESVTEHREFWSWWRMHWLRRDREFLDIASLMFPHERAVEYLDFHTVGGFHFKPHTHILEESYHSMMHKLVKTACAPASVAEGKVKPTYAKASVGKKGGGDE